MEEHIWRLIYEKKRMMTLSLGLVFLFYFLLPLSLIFFPDVMNRISFIQGMSWAWLYGFLQIPMTWMMGWIYHVKAKNFDRKVEEIKQGELL
ncbi:DUF485 domain-containing protein [Oceanobacillus massiliensis]|uniref:DUF485 domain-containing protein n=1 Tax=Oceanobacillus massiliensis TaxID=1465765 RepID=UPI000287F11C|nr:DUF485 domain-containing protein [Oceanobacillus massiliensis]